MSTRSTNTSNDTLNTFYISNQPIISGFGRCDRLRRHHNAFAIFALCEMLPKLFCDERHKWMQQMQQIVEVLQSRFISDGVNGLLVARLNHFKIPRREFIPEEAIYLHQSFRDTILREQICNLSCTLTQLSSEPFCGLLRSFGLYQSLIYLPTLYKAESVPNLVTEVTTLFAQRFIKQDVVTSRGRKHHTHAHSISPKLFD